MYCNYNNNSNTDADVKPKYNNNSNIDNNAKSNNNVLFNSKDNRSNNNTINKDIDRPGCLNSGYNSDRTDVTITKDINKYYIIKLNKYKQPLY
jgi:hypothetical protein